MKYLGNVKDNKDLVTKDFFIRNIDGYSRENLISGTTNDWIVYEKKDGVDTINEAIHYLGELDIRSLSVGDKFTFSFKYAFENLEYGNGAMMCLQAPGDKLGYSRMTGTYPINIDSRNKEGFYSQAIDVTSELKKNDKYGPIYLRIDHAVRGKIKIKELKAEKGDTATPWCYSLNDFVKMKNRAYSGTNDNLLDGSSAEWKEIIINDTKPTKVSYMPNLGKLMGYNINPEQTYTASCTLELENLIADGTPKYIIEAPSKQSGWDKPVFSHYVATKMTNGILKISVNLNHSHNEIEYNPFNLRIENVQSGIIRLKELKIERGEVATAWKPSINDCVYLKRETDGLSSNIGTLNQLNTENKTNIVSAINEINSKNTTNDNLLDGSSNEWKVLEITDGEAKENRIIHSLGMLPNNNLKEGEKYVASFDLDVKDLVFDSGATCNIQAPADWSNWYKGATSNDFIFNNTNGNIRVSIPFKIRGYTHEDGRKIESWGQFSLRIDNVRRGTIKIRRIKIEKGEVATPWKLSINDYIDLEKRVKTLENTVAELVKKAGK